MGLIVLKEMSPSSSLSVLRRQTRAIIPKHRQWIDEWHHEPILAYAVLLVSKQFISSQPIAAAMQDWLFYDDTKVVSERQGSRTLEELDISIELCR